MECSQVRFLQKFGVSSVIMPYFGYAHQSFLLLSRLSRESRVMLDDFYREMVNCLFDCNMRILISDHNAKMLFLPSDLFKIQIDLNSEVILEKFIEFITMRHQLKGNYFNTYYMHERLLITYLDIKLDFIKNLVPYFDILKSIRLVNENNCMNSDSDHDTENCDCTLYNIHFKLYILKQE